MQILTYVFRTHRQEKKSFHWLAVTYSSWFTNEMTSFFLVAHLKNVLLRIRIGQLIISTYNPQPRPQGILSLFDMKTEAHNRHRLVRAHYALSQPRSQVSPFF